MDIKVEAVAPEATYPLRHRVLRPYLAFEEMRPQPGELDPGAVHLAALAPDGEVVGTAVLLREPFAQLAGNGDAWRMRGVAVADGLRGQGIGGRLLDRVLRHVAGQGGGLLWCNARVPARRFYDRAGFRAVGEQWDEPHTGPHVTMWRTVAPDGDERR
jgi:predicted GNAT family N-acyltransferase